VPGFPFCDFPHEIMVQTTSRCNSSCIFCPYQVVSTEIRHTAMSAEHFERLMAECGEHEELKTICLFLMNEPLADPEILARCEAARRENPHAYITIFSNGCDLRPALGEGLLRSRIDHITFGINAHSPETYRAITNRKDFEEVKANVTRLLEERNRGGSRMTVDVRLVGALQLLSPEEIVAAKAYWKPLGVRNVEVFLGHTTRAGNLAGTYQVRHPHIYGCRDGMPYHRAAVLSTGEVTLCCMDWRREAILGDTSVDTLHAIWNSDRRRRMLAALHDEVESPIDFLCKRCVESIPGPTESAPATEGADPDRGVRILTVETLDSEGQPSGDFLTGGAFVVSVRFLVMRTVFDPLVRLQIFNDQNPQNRNLFFFGTNTGRSRRIIGRLAPGEWEARFTLSELNLRAGHYSLTAGVWPDEQSETAFDVRHGRSHFRVLGDETPMEPKVHLPAEWHIEPASDEARSETALSGLELRDPKGSELPAFPTGGGLRMQARYDVAEPGRFFAGVTVCTDGIVLHRALRGEALPGGAGKLELLYPHLHLLEGTYELELELHDRRAGEPACSLAASFEVKSRREDGAGLVRCPWDVRVDRPMYFDETKRQQALLGSGCTLR
jgi:hypothetical protein